MEKLLILTLFCLSFSLQADSSSVEFDNGWIKQLPPVVPMRAGYMQISNTGKTPAEIVAMQSDAFESIEMHETMMEDGMMKMVQQHSIVIPAGASVELKPGGKHIMMINPTIALQVGDKVDISVTFSDEKSQLIQLKVKK